MKFGDVVKWVDAERGPELSRFMVIAPSDDYPRPWARGPVIQAICLAVHPGDEWAVGDGAPFDTEQLEVIE